MRELNYRQRLFVEAYIGEANGNATEAARIAGYSGNDNALGVVGHGLLRNSKIQSLITRRVSCVAMSSSEVLARMAEIATSDIGEFIDIKPDGSYRLNLSKRKRTRLLKKLKTTRTTTKDSETEITDFEVRDPFSALVKLGEYHGLWDRELGRKPASDNQPPKRIDLPRRKRANHPKTDGGDRK